MATQDYSKETMGNVKVYCRLKPPHRSLSDSLQYDNTMIDDGENRYSFDRIFGKYSTQAEVYQEVVRRHIDDFLIGKNSTIFAYGQTGSGKTHTMFGDITNPQHSGIIPRAL